MKNYDTHDQFMVGFASAILLIAASALLLQTFKWFRKFHGSYIEFLTAPMFSFVDLFSVIAIMLMMVVVIISLRYIRST